MNSGISTPGIGSWETEVGDLCFVDRLRVSGC